MHEEKEVTTTNPQETLSLGAEIMKEVKRYDDGMGCTRRQLVDSILILVSQYALRPSAAATVDDWMAIETAPKDGTHILIGTFRDPAPIGFGWCGKPARHQPWQAVVHFWDGAGEEGFYLSTGDRGGAPVTGTHWKALTEPKIHRKSEEGES